MGGGSSSTSTVRKRDPESAELQNLQTGIYNLLAPILGLQASGAAGTGAGTGTGNGTGTSGSGSSSSGRTYTTTYDASNGVPWYEWYDPANTIPDSYYGYDGDGNYNPYRDQSLRGNTMTATSSTNSSSANAAANAAAQDAANWAATQFGNTWADLGNRTDEANRAYDAALRAQPGLQNNLLNTTNQIATLANGAQAALQPNIDRINTNSGLISGLANQLSGLATESQNALQPNINRINANSGIITDIGSELRALAPEGQAALQPNINNINDLSRKLGDLGDTIGDATKGYTTRTGNLNKKIEGVGDRQGDLASTIWAFTENGNIPEEMKRSLMNTVNSELRTNTGSTLNDLASRGVMNSTVANRSINNLSNAAADAYAKNYLEAYNSVLGGYGQTNNTLASQADTYSKAIDKLNTAWNDQLGGYKLAGDQYNSAIGGYNTANNNITQGVNNRLNALNNSVNAYNTANQNYNLANQNITQGYNNRANNINNAISGYNTANQGYNTANANISQGYNNKLTGLNNALSGYQQAYNNNQNQMTTMAAMPQTLAQSAWSKYQPVYDFWKSMRQSYDNREDYDTIVKQGK